MNTTTVVPHRQKMSQILPMDWLLELTLSTFLWWKEVAEASSAIRRVLCGDSRKEPNLGFLIDLVRQKKLVHMCGEGSFIPSICSRVLVAVGIDQATALINEKDHWTDGEQSKLLHRVDFLISMARELEIGPRHGRSLQMKNIFFGELESRLRTEKRKVIVSIKSGNGHYHITEKGDIGGDGLDIQVEGEIYKIPTGLIDPDPEQPREYFDPAQMAETKNSINLMGQQQAGQVFKLPNGRYKLIDGERRFRICRELDIPFFKAEIVTDESVIAKRFLRSLILNFNRAGHTPMETAKSIYRLRTDPDYKMSVKEIAQSLGKSEVWVSQYLSLMQLDQEIQKKLDPGVSKKERLPALGGMHLARVIPVKQVTIYNDLLRRKKLTVIAIQKAVDEAITNEDAARNHRNKLRPPREKRRDDWRRVLETTVSLVEEKADLLLRRSSLSELYAGMDVSRQEIREHIDSAIEKLESIRKQL